MREITFISANAIDQVQCYGVRGKASIASSSPCLSVEGYLPAMRTYKGSVPSQSEAGMDL